MFVASSPTSIPTLNICILYNYFQVWDQGGYIPVPLQPLPSVSKPTIHITFFTCNLYGNKESLFTQKISTMQWRSSQYPNNWYKQQAKKVVVILLSYVFQKPFYYIRIISAYKQHWLFMTCLFVYLRSNSPCNLYSFIA